MSTDVIQAQYGELAAIVERLSRCSQEIADMGSRISGTADPLERGGWQGMGAQAFFAELHTSLNPTVQRLAVALAEAASVTQGVSESMRAAEQEAANLFRDGAVATSAVPSKEAQGNGGGVLGGVGDFFGGAWDEGKDMVGGLWHMVSHPIDTATGLGHAVTHPGELWDALKKPYVDAWESGHPWTAIGRGTLFVVSMVVGAKGIDKVAKAAGIAGKAGEAADVAGTAARVSEAAGTAGHVGETVGSLVNTSGRVLSAEEAAGAQVFVNEGKVVEVLAESTTPGVRTADFLVNGVRTELKTISNITSNDISGAVARRALDGAGQAKDIVLDMRAQPGMTQELAERAIRRAYGADKAARISNIRAIGDGFDVSVPRTP